MSWLPAPSTHELKGNKTPIQSVLEQATLPLGVREHREGEVGDNEHQQQHWRGRRRARDMHAPDGSSQGVSKEKNLSSSTTTSFTETPNDWFLNDRRGPSLYHTQLQALASAQQR